MLDKVFVSDGNGLITSAYPETGVTYTLTELETPEGYATVVYDGETAGERALLSFYSDSTGIHVTGADGDRVTVSEDGSDGTVTITVKNYETEITAVKIDSCSQRPVAGVHFALYRQIRVKTGVRKDYFPMSGFADLVTGDDGVIPGIDGYLPPGVYYLSETEPLDGYYELGYDIMISLDSTGHFSLLPSDDYPAGSDKPVLRETLTEDGKLSYTLNIPNRRKMNNIRLTPQTLVADFGLRISYNAALNNFDVPDKSEYTYVGITSAENADSIGTTEAPELLAAVGQPLAGKYGTVTLSANGDTDYAVTSTMFAGEDTFWLVAHVTKIRGENANVYVYEQHTYIPATTVYYEDDFISDDNYINGVDGKSTGNGFGVWNKASSGEARDYQSADLAGVKDANVFGYDPAYTDCSVYSNGSSHYVSVSETNAPNKGGKWPQAIFDFAGTGFDVISVTSGVTGVFTVRVYDAVTGEQVIDNQVIDTYYGYDYGSLYLDPTGNPTLQETGSPLYSATEEIIETASASSNVVAISGMFVTPTTTYIDPDGSVTETPYYRGADGRVTDKAWYKEVDTGEVISEATLTDRKAGGDDPDRYEPNYSYALAEGWVLNPNAAEALYQIPVIKIRGLKYGTYRARIEPRFLSAYRHYKTLGGYNYFDLYVDAFRVYDPAGVDDSGAISSAVIQEAYNHSD